MHSDNLIREIKRKTKTLIYVTIHFFLVGMGVSPSNVLIASRALFAFVLLLCHLASGIIRVCFLCRRIPICISFAFSFVFISNFCHVIIKTISSTSRVWLFLILFFHYYYYYYYYYTPREFLTTAWADGLLLELSDSKIHQVSRILLSILADLNNAEVWMVSIYPPISNSSSFLSKHLEIVASTPITIGITKSLIFHSF